VSGRFFGCDVSQGMLDQAIVDWPNDDKPSFALVDPNGKLPYQDEFFDVVVISAVLHHIEPQQRAGVYREIARVLKRDGRVYVFEHNLYNPVTRWVVSHTAIDANAILLSPSEVRRGLISAGLADVRTSYIMFFPPHWQWAGWIERLIAWLPLGGQYVVTARRV
jgi:SAM-dependent methyltransferase